MVEERDCPALCSVTGDPHYHTFDGKHYKFMGQCSYTLVQLPDLFTVTAENVACGTSGVTCTKSVKVVAYGKTFHLTQVRKIVVFLKKCRAGIDIVNVVVPML